MEQGKLIRRIVCIVACCFVESAMGQTLTSLTTERNSSLRGLSVVNDRVAWASGSNGWVARTTDGGVNWEWKQVAQYKTLDFRDIEAFSDKKAVIVNAGSPAVILLTENGGETWREVYHNNAPEIFLDGIDFWDAKKGLIFGDPILGQMQLLKTEDGGKTWNDISADLKILLLEGEASFAASGTAIRTLKGGNVWIATGGTRSRIFYSPDYGKNWQAFECPIVQGEASQGPFSIAFKDKRNGVAVGGDYKKDTVRTNNMLFTTDGGQTWQKPAIAPLGFRSAVEYIGRNTLVTTGTSGTDRSTDGGRTWVTIAKEPYNALRKAKKGGWVLLAGAKGKISVFIP